VFDNLSLFFQTLLDGLWLTVETTLIGIVIATVLALVAGLAMMSRFKTVRVIARIYVEIWRGTSEVVQLFWITFVLPVLVGYDIVPLAAGIAVLGLNFGAYGAEIVRGAVRSVPTAQHEGGVALSLSPAQRMRRVILPQALVEMVPPFNNLYIQLLKGSSLLTLIGVFELTYQAVQVLRPRHLDQQGLILFLTLLFYLVLAILITIAMRWVERRAAARVGRTPQRQSFFSQWSRSHNTALTTADATIAGGAGSS
jgi:polar amino acid transport system permease protein